MTPLTPRRRPFVIRRGSRRRLADPFLVDVGVELHFLEDGGAPDVRFGAVDWRQVFGSDRPLRVEIGFGTSDFLIDVALADPLFNYVGFEYSAKRVVKFLKKVHARGAENVRAVCCDLTPVLGGLFEPGSIDRFFALFPDPWPKRRHAKNRFVQPANIDVVCRLLRPGGGITLRTDEPQYAQQMLEVLDAHEELVNLAGPGHFAEAPREDIRTLYERKFREMGRRIYYLEYDRGAPPPAP